MTSAFPIFLPNLGHFATASSPKLQRCTQHKDWSKGKNGLSLSPCNESLTLVSHSSAIFPEISLKGSSRRMLWARRFIDRILFHFHHPRMKRAFLYPHVTGKGPEYSERVHTMRVTLSGSAGIWTQIFLDPKSAYIPLQHTVVSLFTLYRRNLQLLRTSQLLTALSFFLSGSPLHRKVNHLRVS